MSTIYEPDTAYWYIVSLNCDFYLDLDFYSGIDGAIERGEIYVGGDADAKAVLVDIRNKRAVDIISTNCCNDAMDAFWANDSVFVMLCQSLDMQDEVWEPYISVWDRGKILASYLYDGEIKNFRKDEFFPFFKRLQRLGIQIKDME
jgi:hypothetical protein